MAASRSCTSIRPAGCVGGATTLAVRQVRHRSPRSEWGWSPLWPRRCRERNPDASLSARGVYATHFAGRHGRVHRGGSTGSGRRPGVPIRAGESGRSHHRNIGCHGRSRSKSVPVPRIARNCRVDTTAGLPACSSRIALDKPARHWHKGMANVPRARKQEGPGFCQECARAFVYPASAHRIPRGRRRGGAGLPLSGLQRPLTTGAPGKQSPWITINHTEDWNERACSAVIHITAEPRRSSESRGS